jgi:hypothetical protein
VEEAERALRQATAELQEAQSAYQQTLRQYEQALREYAANRIPRETLARCLERLREQGVTLQQRQRALAEKGRLLEEARQAPVRDKP